MPAREGGFLYASRKIPFLRSRISATVASLSHFAERDAKVEIKVKKARMKIKNKKIKKIKTASLR